MFFKLSHFQYFLAFPFLSDLLLNSLGVWLSAHNPSSWVSKNTCVFCFLSCLLSFHSSFVWKGKLAHQTSFPMFSENNMFYLFIVLFSPAPPRIVCAKQAAQPCILPVNYFLTRKQCSCETFNYLCWWHLSWPTPPRFLPSLPVCLEISCIFLQLYACM